MRKDLASIVSMAAMLVVSNVAAIILAPVFFALQFQAFPDASNPVNPLIYVLLILLFTAVILLLFRYRKRNLAKYIVLGSILLTVWFVFIVPLYFALLLVPMDDILRGNLATVLAILLSVFITYAIHKYPEWYVVDTVGISIAAGVTAILGISFAILPAFVLLIALAGYDAWAVYRSKHMVTLADEMTSQRLPILLVVPKKASYSYLEQPRLKEQVARGEEREAMFMGLGDIIIPGTLVVSASIFLRPEFNYPSAAVLGIPAYLFVAALTLVGALAGFAALMRYVMKGNPQAGLPLLNGGAIAGYLVSFLIAFGPTCGLGLTGCA